MSSISNEIDKMLWRKEISGGLYIDLLQNMDYPIYLGRLKRKKNNADALTARMAGNEKFKAGDFHAAMAKYNESICLAENGSEYLSLAYGNRSSCFEKMKMFSNCLIDIQLAKDCSYPERMMQKLNDRKAKCMLEMQSEKLILNQPTLSFPADENLSCMANVLRIDVDNQYGRLITATQDIPIGSTILIEEDYVRYVVGENLKCSSCGKRNVNFIPCEICGGAMFCNELCLKNNFHQVECEMLVDMDLCSDGNFFPLFVLRSLVVGLSAFSSTTEMMKFVENCRNTDQFETPLSTLSATLKYRAFFKLSSFVPNSIFLDLCKEAYFVYQSIKSSSLGDKFQTKSHQRFLIHLIIHHSAVLRTNNFTDSDVRTMMIFGESFDTTHKDSEYEHILLLVTSYLNHSCCPNVAKMKKNNLSICTTILPIRKGDQLFISYVDEDDEDYKTESGRQSYLQNSYGFTCKCRLCEKGILKNTHTLQNDAAFVSVVKDVEILEQNFDLLLVREIIKNCKQFLAKHAKMIPSVESVYILNNFAAMLQLELDYQD